MIYHIPCENDPTARETARVLREKGFECYPALSFHPSAKPFVVVLVGEEGQDMEPVVARGGTPIESRPLHPAPENDHHDHPHEAMEVFEANDDILEYEEETEPDPDDQPQQEPR